MSWEPILTGAAAERALQVARSIATELVAACEHTGNIPRDCILDRGDAGLAVSCAYFHRAGFLETSDAASLFLDRALTAISEHEMAPALMRGFTGIAWSAHHLLDGSDDDPVEPIDDAVLKLLADGPRIHFDLIEGLVGLGTYALARLPRAAAVSMLEHIVERLERTAERSPAGITWFTRPDDRGGEPEAFPDGSYALGFGRGVPGVIALLAATLRHGIATSTSRELLEGAVGWLLAQRIDRRSAMFPIRVFRNPTPHPEVARPAWCFGDVGVALGLAMAARATERDDWKELAIRTARHSATSPLNETQIADAGFCHGACGLAHQLSRIAHTTGDSEIRSGAITWFERALDMRRGGDHAGFSPAVPRGVLDDSGRAGWSLLFGAAGVGLTLVSAATDIAPAWDQVMLVDP